MSGDETAFEREVRTMLRRRADDIGFEDREVPDTRAIAAMRPARTSSRAPRWLLVGAAAMIVVAALGTAVLVRDRSDDLVVGSEAETPTAVPTLPGWFDPNDATAILRTDRDDPRTAAQDYLRTRFPDHPAPGVAVDGVEVAGSRATARWAVPGEPELPYRGSVLLRNDGGAWSVIAATTEGLDLSDVRRDRNRLVGQIRHDHIDLLALDVLTLAGEPVPDAPRPGGYPGAAHRFGTAGTSDDDVVAVDIPLPAREAVLLRIQHVGGTMLSIAELVVPGPQPSVEARQRLASFGIAFDLPEGWSVTGTAGVAGFVHRAGPELQLDWTDDRDEGGRTVTTGIGAARLSDVEGGMRLRIDVPCSWPACRRLDVFAYQFGDDASAEQRLLDIVDGLAVSGPRLSGSLADGRLWTVHQDFDRGLCVQIERESLGCDDTGPVVERDEDPATPRVAAADTLELPEHQHGNLVYGFLPNPPFRPTEASLVRLDYADGRQRAENVITDARTGLWAAPVVPGDLPDAITYLDEGGQPIETHPIFG